MYEQLAELVESLHAKTMAGEVEWRKATIQGFDAHFPTYSLNIRQRERAGRPIGAIISLFNEEGELVEKFSDEELRDHGPQISRDYLDLMAETYEMARRKALKADQVVRGIIEALRV